MGVAINEAVEVAKIYGGDESPKFVNGVLGRIATTCAGTADADVVVEGGAATGDDAAAEDGAAVEAGAKTEE